MKEVEFFSLVPKVTIYTRKHCCKTQFPATMLYAKYSGNIVARENPV